MLSAAIIRHLAVLYNDAALCGDGVFVTVAFDSFACNRSSITTSSEQDNMTPALTEVSKQGCSQQVSHIRLGDTCIT